MIITLADTYHCDHYGDIDYEITRKGEEVGIYITDDIGTRILVSRETLERIMQDVARVEAMQ